MGEVYRGRKGGGEIVEERSSRQHKHKRENLHAKQAEKAHLPLELEQMVALDSRVGR